ncbi:hypothetical protein JCM5296_001583 [Sporobolomyces johnsonii]
MRLPLHPTPSLLAQLSHSSTPSDPPLLFIDQEPFLIELQGSLQLPPGEDDHGGDYMHAMAGTRVGNVDLSDPKKPVLRIAHHRLEGRLEPLLTPYALLRTTPTSSSSSSSEPDPDPDPQPSSKRPRLSPSLSAPRPAPPPPLATDSNSTSNSADDDDDSPPTAAPATHIAIIGLVRQKIVFSKRPEPLVELSSDADPDPPNTRSHGAGGGGGARPGRAAGGA